MTLTMTSSDALLSDEFAELSRFVPKWALETSNDRSACRQSCGMDELREFYDAMLPHVRAAAASLSGIAVDDLGPQQRNLFKILMSLAEVAPGVECFDSPTVPWGYDVARFPEVDVPHMSSWA